MDNKLRIIGIAGTNGSGKDSLGQILANKYGYLFVSVTEILRDELRRRQLPVNRENLRNLSAAWRRESAKLGILIDEALKLYQQSSGHRGLAIASLRNVGEVERVHQLGGRVVWVDAQPRLRYDRVQANRANRGERAGEDNKTFEQFLDEEAAEMKPAAGSDQAVLNMDGVKAHSDIFITNNSQDISQLEEEVSQRLLAGEA